MSGLALVCTDRGQHPAVELARVGLAGQAVRVSESRGRRTSNGQAVTVTRQDGRVTRRTRPGGAAVWELRCPRCGRAPRVPSWKLAALVTSGVSRFDLSQASM